MKNYIILKIVLLSNKAFEISKIGWPSDQISRVTFLFQIKSKLQMNSCPSYKLWLAYISFIQISSLFWSCLTLFEVWLMSLHHHLVLLILSSHLTLGHLVMLLVLELVLMLLVHVFLGQELCTLTTMAHRYHRITCAADLVHHANGLCITMVLTRCRLGSFIVLLSIGLWISSEHLHTSLVLSSCLRHLLWVSLISTHHLMIGCLGMSGLKSCRLAMQILSSRIGLWALSLVSSHHLVLGGLVRIDPSLERWRHLCCIGCWCILSKGLR